MLSIHDVPTCSTLEPNIFKQYFFDRVQQLVGLKEAGRRFLAITDPGSKLQQVAERDGFRRVSLRVWNSDRAFCTRRDRPTKGGRTRAYFSRSPVMTRSISRCRGQKYTFGVVKAAQARGDFQMLVERGRRALRAHLGTGVAAGLQTL